MVRSEPNTTQLKYGKSYDLDKQLFNIDILTLPGCLKNSSEVVSRATAKCCNQKSELQFYP